MFQNRSSEIKGLIRKLASVGLSVTLAASLAPVPAVAADANSSFGSDAVLTESAAIDITAQWNAGGMTITAGGRYVLSGDVHSAGSLVIAAPKGETVTLDLQGHTAEVRGNVQAAIIVDDTQGRVEIYDSMFDSAVADGSRAADDEPAACIRLVSTASPTSVAAVRWNASEDAKAEGRAVSLSHVKVQAALLGADETVAQDDKLGVYAVYAGFAYDEEDPQLDLTLDGVLLEAVVSNADVAEGKSSAWANAAGASVAAEHAGIAADLMLQAKGLKLKGALRATAASDGGAVQVLAAHAESIALQEGFESKDALRVHGDGVAVDGVFATCANEELAQKAAAWFADAAGGLDCKASENNVTFAAKTAASASEEAQAAAVSAQSDDSGESAGAKAVAAMATTEREANKLLTTAVEGSPLKLPAWVSSLAEASTDLSKAWTESGTTKSFTISESGTYFLSSDLTVSTAASLIVNGQIDVTLQLNGHKLTIESDSTVGVKVLDKANLTVEGGTSAGGQKGSIVCDGAKLYDGVSMESTGALTLSNVAVTVRPSIEHSSLHSLNTRAVDAKAGTVSVRSCELTVDQTNVSNTSSSLPAVHPAGIYSDNTSKATVSVEDSTIKVVASPVTIRTDKTDLADAEFTGSGYSAYGIYNASRNAVTVRNCQVSVNAASGMAIGLRARNASVEGNGLSVTAISQYVCAAVQSAQEEGVKLNAPVSLKVTSGANPRRQATLYGSVDKAFGIGSGFAGSAASALVRVDGTENLAGMMVGTFSYSPSTSDLARFTSNLSNGLGDDVSCDVEATASGVSFVLNDSRAAATVVHKNGKSTAYSSANEALAAVADGETVRLARDADAVSVSGKQAGQSITLDLAGHSIDSLANTCAADLAVVSSAGRGKISGTALTNLSGAGYDVAVYHAGAGALSLSNVDISATGRQYMMYGILVNAADSGSTGNVSCEGVSLVLSPSNNSATAVSVQGGTGKAAVSFAGGNVSVLQSSVSSGAYAFENRNADASISLVDCPVSVEAVAGSAAAVSTSGAFSARSDTPLGQTITVQTSGASDNANGIFASSAAVSLENVAMSVKGASQDADADSYCLRDSSNGSKNVSTWSIDGTCSFESSAGKVLYERGASLKLGASFANAGDGSIAVCANDVSSDAFGAVDSANATADDVLASWFVPVTGTAYDGWSAAVSSSGGSGKGLVWTREALVTNASTGKTYASFTRALAEANSGDTLKLVDDGAVHGVQTVTQADLKIDLAGHSLSLYGGSETATGALNFSGSGTLSIVDSAAAGSRGKFSLYVGSSAERSVRSAEEGSAYCGIYVAKGSVDIEDADVQVLYNGGGANAKQSTVEAVGCYVAAGNATVGANGKLSVSGAAEEGGACASQAFALYAAAGCAGRVSVDGSATVSADNAGALIQAGEILNGNSTTDYDHNNQVLRRIEPDEGSTLYQEILQKFRAQAKLDDGSTGNDYSFGERVYYVDSMVLDDGTLVWAVSDQVAIGQEIQANITPKAIFVQTYYSIAPKAIGVSAAAGSSAAVSVSGSVNASAAKGDAYAVSAAGAGAWSVSGAALSAKGGQSAYEGADSAKINLADYITVDKVPTDTTRSWFYPSDCTAHELVSCDPFAVGVSVADGANLTLAGATTVSTSAAATEDIRANSFRVAASYKPASDEALTVGNAAGENTSGSTFTVPASGATLSKAWFADAYSKLSPVSASDGSLAWDGPYTVTFHSENGVAAQYTDLLAGATVELPPAADMQKQSSAYTTNEFLGWATSASATEAAVAADAGTVTVSGSVDYYPVYRTSAKAVTVTFSNLRDASGSLLPAQQATVGYGQTFAEATTGAAAPTQASYTSGDATYRFVGWRDSSGTVWDSQTFKDDVTFDYATISDSLTGAVSLTAAFVRVEPGQHLVTFKVDGAVSAYAAADGSTPTYYLATGGSAVAPGKISTQSGYLYSFRGWHNGRINGTSVGEKYVDYDSTTTLPAVSADVTYTACFESAKQTAYVEFYYYQNVDGEMKYTKSDVLSVEYGADPISEANKCVKVGDAVVVNGSTYTFLGWSTRKDDKDALYTNSLPAATCTETGDRDVPVYYGIYQSQEQTVTVNFYDGSTVYATAIALPASSTVYEALQSTGVSKPAAKDGKSFLGWATAADAAAADANDSSKLSDLTSNGQLNLYAVYGEAFQPTLTFVSAEGSVLGTVTVSAGASLLNNSDIPTPPAVEGYYFKGWQQPNGQLLDMAAGALSTMRLTAAYGDILTNAVEGDEESTVNGYVDVSRASLVCDDALGASQVVFALNNQSAVDATLTAQAKVNGDKIIADAVYSGSYLIDNKKLSVTSDAGSIVVTVGIGSVSRDSKVRVYWMDGGGTVRYTSALDASSGQVRFTLSNYAALSTSGNIAVAEVGADTSLLGASGQLNGGTLSNANGNSLSGSTTVGGTLSKSATTENNVLSSGAAALGSAGAADAADAGAEAHDAIDLLSDKIDTSVAISDIAGNPVTWVIVLLLLAAIGAFAWYFLVGRRRKGNEEPEDEDAAGWSDDAASAAAAAAGAAGTAATAAPAGNAGAGRGSGNSTGGISF